ncbi:MAG: hypothetical protein K9M98_12265 [Cephaloticoccus sp.]|nr:hypothetical protein [Cephaloticoccus sp.]MCF7761267.1 hypothetical protein [Cephaloticoccus sp.]
MKSCLLLGLVVGLAFPTSGSAQAPTPPAEAHQFDFWIGEWNVTTPDGKTAGTNSIRPISGGFGLLENWQGTGGGSGKSLNTYNRAKGQWQQFWVGQGGVLELSGGLDVQGRMVLQGTSVTPRGTSLNRITWTPNKDGTVRQHWENSRDQGATWQTVFDGLYTRKE